LFGVFLCFRGVNNNKKKEVKKNDQASIYSQTYHAYH
jgi:hypothetical protein